MGLEGKIYTVIKRDAPRLWGDFYFDNGLVPHNPQVAEEIVQALNASGEFGKAKYNPSTKRIEFARYYNKITMREIVSSFIGNTIIPHLDYLKNSRGIDIKNKKKVIEEFKKDGMDKYVSWLESQGSSAWDYMVELVNRV
jgi:hypothetical protein